MHNELGFLLVQVILGLMIIYDQEDEIQETRLELLQGGTM